MARRWVLLLAVTLLAGACGDEDADPPVATTAAATASPTTSLPPATSSSAPATTTTAAAAPSGPGYGGVAIIGEDQHAPTLNPYALGGDNWIVSIIGQAIHTGVFDVDPVTLERIPEVVTELPTVQNGGIVVNDDGTMTVHFTIRDEAQWADGTPISGDDFAFTYTTLTDPTVAAATFPNAIDNPYLLVDPASLEIGAKSFGFTLVTPSLEHEQMFRWLIPRHQVEGTAVLNDWNGVPWLSGGPFVFDTWEPEERITLMRNDNYWKVDKATGDQLPYLDVVVFEFIPETETLLQSFTSRELDVIAPPPYAPYLDDLQALEGAEVTIGPGPIWEQLNFQFGEMNRNSDSLNRYVDFRRAVAHAIDRHELLDVVQEGHGGEPLSSYLDVYSPALSTGAWDRYDYDPERARELLQGLCAELERDCDVDPPHLIFSTTSNGDIRVRIADWLVEELGDVGIDVELQLEDSQIFFGETLEQGTWDLGLWAWAGAPGLSSAAAIHDVFDPQAPPPDGSNYYRWGTPATTGESAQGPSLVADEHTTRFAEIVAAMRSTVDETELTALIQEAEAILADQVVIIPLFSRLSAGAVWADEIGGYVSNPTQASHTWNIEEWYRRDR